MIQGTASGVGKSIITLALCRIFRQDGYSVAPFKSQNMTSNTAKTKKGGEIAVSQLLQAYAAGVEPDTLMNPVIINPALDKMGTQVLLHGEPYGRIGIENTNEVREALLPEIMKAYEALSAQHDIIVIEGAGSPVELNLNSGDIVNMGIAKRTGSPVLLVSDIDRGGVFASFFGTVGLLGDTEREFVKALVVNRFCGDVSLFSDGRGILERITGVPVVGVIPFISIDLPEEDGLCSSNCVRVLPGYDERQFDVIADHVRGALDMEHVYMILNESRM